MENYFELYQIKPLFHNDPAVITERFNVLDKQFKSEAFLQPAEALAYEADHMSEVNKQALKTLLDPVLLMGYILRLHGYLEDGEDYPLDPDFLIEMMELNELATEYELEPGNDLIKTDALEALNTELQYWEEETDPLFKKFDGGDHSKELLLQIKDYYFRGVYLREVQKRMDAIG